MMAGYLTELEPHAYNHSMPSKVPIPHSIDMRPATGKPVFSVLLIEGTPAGIGFELRRPALESRHWSDLQRGLLQ